MKWQMIETAPRDGTPLLAWASGWGSPDVVWWRPADPYSHEEGWCDGMTDNFGDLLPPAEPTHWMPLPDPPEPTP